MVDGVLSEKVEEMVMGLGAYEGGRRETGCLETISDSWTSSVWIGTGE
jgi:hypothetical protein